MTQYLLEEAVLMRPRVDETNRAREWEAAREEDAIGDQLLARHAELQALKTTIEAGA